MSIPSEISIDFETKKFDRSFLSNSNLIYIYSENNIFRFRSGANKHGSRFRRIDNQTVMF